MTWVVGESRGMGDQTVDDSTFLPPLRSAGEKEVRGRGGVPSLMFWWGMPMHTSRSGRACWWRQYPFVQVCGR